ncbi:MAG: hypothetical protein AAF702_44545 [Chloroflexota bacterium]
MAAISVALFSSEAFDKMIENAIQESVKQIIEEQKKEMMKGFARASFSYHLGPSRHAPLKYEPVINGKVRRWKTIADIDIDEEELRETICTTSTAATSVEGPGLTLESLREAKRALDESRPVVDEVELYAMSPRMWNMVKAEAGYTPTEDYQRNMLSMNIFGFPVRVLPLLPDDKLFFVPPGHDALEMNDRELTAFILSGGAIDLTRERDDEAIAQPLFDPGFGVSGRRDRKV